MSGYQGARAAVHRKSASPGERLAEGESIAVPGLHCLAMWRAAAEDTI